MVEVWKRIIDGGARMWQNATKETLRQGDPLSPPPFFISRGFDNPADIGLAALLDASLRRGEREKLEGLTTTGTLRDFGIGQEGLIPVRNAIRMLLQAST